MHHGDGVQAAFYDDPRVLTLSIHESPLSLWPGTGWPAEIGSGSAAGTAVNIPVPAGTGDAQWLRAFHAVVPGLVRAFRPDVLVTQHGADSHADDPLADLEPLGRRPAGVLPGAAGVGRNVAANGRWRLALGGGGYSLVKVVPRAWTHLLAIVSDRDVDPSTALPDGWLDVAAAARPGMSLPATMSDDMAVAYEPWDPDHGQPVDKSIAEVRGLVYPLQPQPATRSIRVTEPRVTEPRVTEPGRYPQHWEADVLLADGGAVHLRPADPPAPTGRASPGHARTDERQGSPGTCEVLPGRVPHISPSQRDRSSPRSTTATSVGLVAELGGEIIAAVVPARPATTATIPMEVAFVVEDAQQRRGLGSILLEHLAAAAQERGIKRFTAEVLGENQGMVRVFIDAGYEVKREFSSGIVDLGFDIEPTAASLAVITAREQRAEARSIARLLSPRAVAVIGASNETLKLGHAVLVNLLRAGFTGPVYPVNPETLSVQGVRAYKSVLDIPDPVDVAVVTVPAASVAEVLESCRIKGVHGLVIVTGGFADADVHGGSGGGADSQRRMVAMARAIVMRVLGPNCLGVYTDPASTATLAPAVPPPGRVGFFASPGPASRFGRRAASRGLGLSSFVSAGNRADVSGNDLLQFWHGDERNERAAIPGIVRQPAQPARWPGRWPGPSR